MENKANGKELPELGRDEMEKVVGGGNNDDLDPMILFASDAYCRTCNTKMKQLVGGKYKCDNKKLPCPEFGLPKGENEVNWR